MQPGRGPATAPPLTDRLAGELGREAVALRQQLSSYAVDGVTPQAVVFAKDVATVSTVLKLAAAEKLAVTARGGGTAMAQGYRPERLDIVVSTRRMERLLEHEPAEMTATVEAGMTLGTLNAILEKDGQWLPLEVPLPNRATLGGVLAANCSGAHRFGYGTARDRLLGLKVVDASGTVVKGGGKVVKNVAGYDLPKLFIGSLGTLGVIVEATFKLAPLPQMKQAILGAFTELEEAMEAARALLASGLRPTALELLNTVTMAHLATRCGVPSMSDRRFFLAMDVSNGPTTVQRQSLQAHRIIVEAGGKSLLIEDAFTYEGFWRALADIGRTEDRPASMQTKASLLMSDLARLVHGAEALAESSRMEVAVAASLAAGVLRCSWWGLLGGPAEPTMLIESVGTLRKAATNLNGTFIVESCDWNLKRSVDVWGPKPAGFGVMQRVKEQFDPQRILSPGRFVGGL